MIVLLGCVMNRQRKHPMSVALYGMDERTSRVMTLFLQGPCKGIAHVVDEQDAEVDIIDADHIEAKVLLDERKTKAPDRPIILLSLEQLSIEGTTFVKKPIQMLEFSSVLSQIGSVLKKQENKITETVTIDIPALKTDNEKKPTRKTIIKRQASPKNVDSEEIKKTSKHQTALELMKGRHSAHSSYINHVEGLEFSNWEKSSEVSFSPKNYFLGYVQSAFKIAKTKGHIVQLDSGWRPLVIFPSSHEIWLNVEDKQLKAFAGIARKDKPGKKMALTPFDMKSSQLREKMECFYDMDTFIWKLAVWTSKGRYPCSIDIDRPIYLEQWPNFTRVLVTPHALRIAALLVDGPRTARNVIDLLAVKPQYVFIFISAAHAVGLLGQAKRQVDEIILPEIKTSKTRGLLSRMLSKLRK